ncbi:beta strand repeat-containing protein [Ferrovum myxofaciens]|uniref:beta strand repeat-containing protein n=1 Tax=Ferrovum myxofaciens TaxID=416213 RepID=UPI0023533A61|nr:hypothetical protein [Ferrovum myxofaciens]MBU6994215.1 hypothetical protein [Ferrovum myxofaciens]
MSINMSTQGVEIARYAGAMYGLVLDDATVVSVENAANAGGSSLNAVMNQVYAADFSSISNATVATTVVTNLGLTGSLQSQAQAYVLAQLNAAPAGSQGATIMTILNMFGQMTSDPVWGAAATAWENKVSESVTYGQNKANVANSSIGGMSPTPVGGTYDLTTGVDTLSGGPNATFIADNTGSAKTLSAADTIAATGTGNTLKVYLAAADTTTGGTAGNITGVQNLYINHAGATAALTQDFSTSSFTSITVDSEAFGAAALTLKGQALTLENTGYGATITDTTDTSLTVTVSAMSAGTLTTTGASKATTLNLVSSGTITGGNVVTLSTNAIDTALNVSGATAITVTAGATGSADLTSITDTGTGGNTFDISVATANAAFTFTGGSGGDTLILAAGDLTTLTSGSQLNGGGSASAPATLEVNDTSFSTAAYTALNATTNFQILDLNAAGTTINASLITAGFHNHFAISAGSTNTISNMADASTVDISAAAVSDVLGGVVGAHTLNLNLQSGSVGMTETGITVTGLTTINLTSNTSTAGDANAVTAFTNSDNTTFNVTGSAALSMAVTAATTTGDTINASAFTGAFTLNATSGKGDIISTGSGTTSITDIASATGNTDTLLAGHTAIDTINTTANLAPGTAYTATTLTAAMDQISNFNIGATASDILKMDGGTKAVGVTADLGGTWTVTNGIATTSGTNTAAAFIAAVDAAVGTAGDVVAYTNGTNTYVAAMDALAGKAYVVELVGVHTATAVGITAAANTIHIA